MRYIFDLDHTLICSAHRQLTKADGSLDLAHWRENCTREKIFSDRLLPLAEYALGLIARGHEVIACTARILSEHDHDFLEANGLHFSRVLSRPADCTDMSDSDLKENLLRQDAATVQQDFPAYADAALMFDDNEKVLQRMESIGILAFNAKSLNKANP